MDAWPVHPYNVVRASMHDIAMTQTSLIAQLADRAERLLLRHDELRRTNALLEQQLDVLTRERDSLRSRLQAARSRVDALIARLPQNQPATQDTPAPDDEPDAGPEPSS